MTNNNLHQKAIYNDNPYTNMEQTSNYTPTNFQFMNQNLGYYEPNSPPYYNKRLYRDDHSSQFNSERRISEPIILNIDSDLESAASEKQQPYSRSLS